MKAHLKFGLLLAAAAAVTAFMLDGVVGLSPFGHYPGPYGDILAGVTVAERHVLNVATAINFDYRGFDTLIEEFILFTAVAGVTALFREQVGPHERITDEPDIDREIPPESDGIGWMTHGFVAIGTLFASYIAIHGALTPGGGFQGGAIAGSTFALIYLGVHYSTYKRFAKREAADALEAIGAGGYALIGVATAVASGIFLKNVLPLAPTGSLASGGTIVAINACVFVEVSAGAVVCLEHFFKQTRKRETEET
jgi:multicomponent Na+:H+ antiporter subunit B